MKSIAMAVPVLPGGSEVLRAAAEAVQGPRRQEYQQFMKRMGITQESWYLQPTPDGEIVIFHLEGEDLGQTFGTLAASQEPFDVWFKDMAKQVHGIDFNEPPAGPLPEVILEAQAG